MINLFWSIPQRFFHNALAWPLLVFTFKPRSQMPLRTATNVRMIFRQWTFGKTMEKQGDSYERIVRTNCYCFVIYITFFFQEPILYKPRFLIGSWHSTLSSIIWIENHWHVLIYTTIVMYNLLCYMYVYIFCKMWNIKLELELEPLWPYL